MEISGGWNVCDIVLGRNIRQNGDFASFVPEEGVGLFCWLSVFLCMCVCLFFMLVGVYGAFIQLVLKSSFTE